MSAGRILVVDDDPQIRRVMRVTLTGQGYEVDDAKNGEAALEKLRDSRFDLVLLDMNMPGIGGLETCRAIRGQSDIGIIMLTVRDSEPDKVEALDAGADDYITKPFNAPELLARIRAALRRTPSMQEPTGRMMLGSVEIDFDARQVRREREDHAAHAEGVRAAPLSGRTREQDGVAPRAAAGGLGSGLRRPGGLPPRVHQPAPEEDRAPPVEPVIAPDRAVGGLSAQTVRRLPEEILTGG